VEGHCGANAFDWIKSFRRAHFFLKCTLNTKHKMGGKRGRKGKRKADSDDEDDALSSGASHHQFEIQVGPIPLQDFHRNVVREFL
jgi:hypothetical protein